MSHQVQYILVVVAGSLLIAGLRLLTVPATIASAVMALVLLFAGGWSWLAPPLTFLFLSGLWTRWPGASRERDRTRRARQVVANGLAPTLFAAVALLFDNTAAMAAAVTGSFAAAAADTWATEWGGSFGGKPLDLRTFKQTEPGRSGAVSILGTMASVAGAASVAMFAWWAGMLPAAAIVIVILAGTAGSLLDSIVGAWMQGIWRSEGGTLTENPRDAGQKIRGVRWIDNDVVNFIATAGGGLLAWWWAG